MTAAPLSAFHASPQMFRADFKSRPSQSSINNNNDDDDDEEEDDDDDVEDATFQSQLQRVAQGSSGPYESPARLLGDDFRPAAMSASEYASPSVLLGNDDVTAHKPNNIQSRPLEQAAARAPKIRSASEYASPALLLPDLLPDPQSTAKATKAVKDASDAVATTGKVKTPRSSQSNETPQRVPSTSRVRSYFYAGVP